MFGYLDDVALVVGGDAALNGVEIDELSLLQDGRVREGLP